MPDRIVRAGILTSEGVNSLSYGAEVFYRRLMSVVDDYGRYDGRAAILRAVLYPLQLSRVSEPDIGKWTLETGKARLVRMYISEGKPFLELVKFGQKIRSKSKWPDPPTSADSCQHLPADVPVVVDVGVCDVGRSAPIIPAGFAGFWETYPGPRKNGKAPCLAFWVTNKLEATAEQIALHVAAMAASPQWQAENGKFVPAPLRYLKERRFEDGFPTAPARRLVV